MDLGDTTAMDRHMLVLVQLRVSALREDRWGRGIVGEVAMGRSDPPVPVLAAVNDAHRPPMARYPCRSAEPARAAAHDDHIDHHVVGPGSCHARSSLEEAATRVCVDVNRRGADRRAPIGRLEV
jgi:hypothetical protein